MSESPEVSDEVSEDSPKEVKKTSTKGVRKVQLKPSPAAKEQVSSSDEESFRPSSPEDKEKIETKPKRQPLQKGLRKRDNDDLLPGGGYNSHNKTRQPQKRVRPYQLLHCHINQLTICRICEVKKPNVMQRVGARAMRFHLWHLGRVREERAKVTATGRKKVHQKNLRGE